MTRRGELYIRANFFHFVAIKTDLSITNPLYFYIWTFQSPNKQKSFRNKASLISLGIHWFIFCCCQRRGPWWLRNLWSLRSLSRKRAIKGRASFCLLQKSPRRPDTPFDSAFNLVKVLQPPQENQKSSTRKSANSSKMYFSTIPDVLAEEVVEVQGYSAVSSRLSNRSNIVHFIILCISIVHFATIS